ncbi:hypothetical protein JCM5353_007326 [Sporobolomyces roseus]
MRVRDCGGWDKGIKAKRESWELQLLSATDADALAVHRLLLYLPPARPRPRSPSQQTPAYRNSLLLYDHHRQRVVSVLPLDVYSPPRQRPARGPLPPLLTSNPLPNPPSRPLSPGAQLAKYVDRPKDSNKRRLLTREACKEEKEWDPFQLGDILLAVPPSGSPPEASKKDTIEEVAEKDYKEEKTGEASSSLNPEPATLASSTSKARSIRSGVAPSKWSVSSFATFGSDRFVTADEFEDTTETSRRSSFATILEGSEHSHFASTIRDMQELTAERNDSEEEDERTPTPTRINDPRLASSPGRIAATPSIAAQPLPASPLDPEHTLTIGNAVLLSFLGASSIAPSSTNRIRVSTHPLSADQVSEQIDAGSIEPAKMDIGEGEEKKGWLNWLTSLFIGSEKGKADVTFDLKTKGWLGWLPWIRDKEQTSISSDAPNDLRQAEGQHNSPPSSERTASAAPSKSSTSSRNPVRRFGRASGENTSRLSVIYVDGEGRGSKAFVGRG